MKWIDFVKELPPIKKPFIGHNGKNWFKFTASSEGSLARIIVGYKLKAWMVPKI